VAPPRNPAYRRPNDPRRGGFTRKSVAKIEPTSVATADVYPAEHSEDAVYPTECNEGVYPEERSED